MATRLTTAAQNAACDAVVDLVDVDAGAGTIKIYSGAQPASANDAASGSLLATIAFADPAFGSATSGTASATDPASVNASATGTAGWFRVADNSGDTVWDGACGTSTSVTATAATDTFTTAAAHGLAVGHVIHLGSGITGVAAGDYTVIEVPTTTTFKIATYGSSTPANVSADSSGSYSTAELVLSSLALTSGNPVDVSSFTFTQPAG